MRTQPIRCSFHSVLSSAEEVQMQPHLQQQSTGLIQIQHCSNPHKTEFAGMVEQTKRLTAPYSTANPDL